MSGVDSAKAQGRVCARCGVTLKHYALGRLCPHCMLNGGLIEPGPGAASDAGPDACGTPPASVSGLPHAFGDYELLELIARGGMGVVYKARQKSLNRTVAVKMLLSGPFAEPKFVQRFRAEAEAVAQLQHPNIVAIHEIGECDGQPFFSMDYVEGKNLAQMCVDLGSRGVEFRRCADWLKTIAEAVHYAHERGIIHRDLKPSNVLIDSFGRPRITDFGLAKRLTGDSDLTLSGQVLGSPNYLPPEQADPKRGAVGPVSDIYALGAILYHLVTGRPPFQAESLTTLLRQVIETEPVAPRSLNPSIPRDLDTICLKCLEKEAPRRYSTAQDLANDLGRFLTGEPIAARPVGAVGQAWKWCRRRPALAGLSAGLVLALASGLGVALWQLERTLASELAAQQNAYAADMDLAQTAVEQGDLGAAMNLLNAHRPAPGHKDFRGWEWRYLWKRCQSDELFELTRSDIPKERADFTPDGRRLVVLDRLGQLVLWNLDSRQPVSSFKVWGYLRPWVLARQTNLLAYAVASEPAVSIVDLNTGREIARLLSISNVAQLAFSEDASKLFTLTHNGVFTRWDITSKQKIRSPAFPLTDIFSQVPVAFSPKGDLVAFGARPERRNFGGMHEVGLWVVNSGNHTQLKLPGPRDTVTSLRFSPDGRLLAAGVGETESEVHVWRVEDLGRATRTAPSPYAKFGPHRDWIFDLAFSPDGRALASASADSTLQVWQFDHSEVSRRYQGHRHQVLSVAWSPDGTRIATAGMDGSVRIWDPTCPPPAQGPTMLPIPPAHWCFRLSPDGRRALTLDPTNGMPVLWDTATVQILERLDFAGSNHSRLAWSQDGRRMAATDERGNIGVWDLASHRLVVSLAIPGFSIRNPFFSRDGRFLACSGLRPEASTFKAWNLDTGLEVTLPPRAMEELASADFSPDWRRLIALHSRGALEVWDVASGRSHPIGMQPLSTPTTESCVVCAPDGRALASITPNGVLALWDVETGHSPVVIPRSAQELWNLAFSPDGTRLLVTGRRSSDVLRLLDLSSKRFVATLSGKPDVYMAVRMSADGNTVYAVGEETVLLWRAPSWAEIEAAEKGAP